MRKNDLIKLLTEIPGNPEIVLWNGYVGDYQHINPELTEGLLFKHTLHSYLDRVRTQSCIDTRNWDYQIPESEIEHLKKMYKKVVRWELNSYVRDEDIKEGRFSKKRVIFIDAKLRNISTFDRCGTVSY